MKQGAEGIPDVLEEAMQLIVSLKWAAELGRGLPRELEMEVGAAVRRLREAKERIGLRHRRPPGTVTS